MLKLPTVLVVLAALFGRGDSDGIQVGVQRGTRTAQDSEEVRAREVRGGRPQNPTTTRTTNADTFYKPNTVQEIHLQVREADLEKMRSALPERIYVPATFRWRNQTFENVGLRYKIGRAHV